MSSGTQPPHYDSNVDFLNFLSTGQSSRICKNDPAAALRGHRESGNFKFSGLLLIHLYLHGWQGWPSGESTCRPSMWPRFNFCTQRHMWIGFVGSLFCSERVSPGTPVFSSHQKPTFDLI